MTPSPLSLKPLIFWGEPITHRVILLLLVSLVARNLLRCLCSVLLCSHFHPSKGRPTSFWPFCGSRPRCRFWPHCQWPIACRPQPFGLHHHCGKAAGEDVAKNNKKLLFVFGKAHEKMSFSDPPPSCFSQSLTNVLSARRTTASSLKLDFAPMPKTVRSTSKNNWSSSLRYS